MSSELKPTIRITRKCAWRFPPTQEDLLEYASCGQGSPRPLDKNGFGGIYVEPKEPEKI